jgi:hypothetical protein
MVRTQVQLTQRQAGALREIAARRGVSIAELIRQGTERFLNEDAHIDAEERKRRALGVAGRFRSGVRDLGKAHDRHLSEAIGGT